MTWPSPSAVVRSVRYTGASGPSEGIGSEMPEALPDKEATLLIYCRSGRRSKDAAQKLLALGYQSVYDFGGIIDWPYELVKEG